MYIKISLSGYLRLAYLLWNCLALLSPLFKALDDLCSSPIAWAPGLLQENIQCLGQSLLAMINPTDSEILNASINLTVKIPDYKTEMKCTQTNISVQDQVRL